MFRADKSKDFGLQSIAMRVTNKLRESITPEVLASRLHHYASESKNTKTMLQLVMSQDLAKNVCTDDVNDSTRIMLKNDMADYVESLHSNPLSAVRDLQGIAFADLHKSSKRKNMSKRFSASALPEPFDTQGYDRGKDGWGFFERGRIQSARGVDVIERLRSMFSTSGVNTPWITRMSTGLTHPLSHMSTGFISDQQNETSADSNALKHASYRRMLSPTRRSGMVNMLSPTRRSGTANMLYPTRRSGTVNMLSPTRRSPVSRSPVMRDFNAARKITRHVDAQDVTIRRCIDKLQKPLFARQSPPKWIPEMMNKLASTKETQLHSNKSPTPYGFQYCPKSHGVRVIQQGVDKRQAIAVKQSLGLGKKNTTTSAVPCIAESNDSLLSALIYTANNHSSQTVRALTRLVILDTIYKWNTDGRGHVSLTDIKEMQASVLHAHSAKTDSSGACNDPNAGKHIYRLQPQQMQSSHHWEMLASYMRSHGRTADTNVCGKSQLHVGSQRGGDNEAGIDFTRRGAATGGADKHWRILKGHVHTHDSVDAGQHGCDAMQQHVPSDASSWRTTMVGWMNHSRANYLLQLLKGPPLIGQSAVEAYTAYCIYSDLLKSLIQPQNKTQDLFGLLICHALAFPVI
jgi:hypothetical protein